MVDIGQGLQPFVDVIAKFFGFFREILSAFPFPIQDHLETIVLLMLVFAVASIVLRFLG